MRSRGHLSLLLLLAGSVKFLQLRLQRLEVADGMLQGRVGAQRLQLHQVTADVVQTHVSESASETGAEQTVEVQVYLRVLDVLVSLFWSAGFTVFIFSLPKKKKRIYKANRLYLHSKTALKRPSVC